jgi:hypothetical protein
VDAGVIVNPYDPHGTGSSLVDFSRPLQRRSLRVELIQHPIYQFGFFPYLNTHVPTLGHTTVYYPQNTAAWLGWNTAFFQHHIHRRKQPSNPFMYYVPSLFYDKHGRILFRPEGPTISAASE